MINVLDVLSDDEQKIAKREAADLADFFFEHCTKIEASNHTLMYALPLMLALWLDNAPASQADRLHLIMQHLTNEARMELDQMNQRAAAKS